MEAPAARIETTGMSIRKLVFLGSVILVIWGLSYLYVPADRESLIPVRNFEGKWGYVDRNGRVGIPFEWGRANSFVGDLARVERRRGGDVGFINRDGDVVIPLKWDYAGDFDDNGFAGVGIGRKCGFINRDGEVVIPLRWWCGDVGRDVLSFDSGGLAKVKVPGQGGWKIGFINRSGEEVIPITWDSVGDFSESGFATVTLDGNCGVIDREGKLAVEPKWSYLERFDFTEMAVVSGEMGGKTGFEVVDYYGVGNVPPWILNANREIRDWRKRVAVGSKEGFTNAEGKLVIDVEWDTAKDYSDDGSGRLLAAVGKREHGALSCGYINIDGEIVIPLDWKEAGTFRNGTAAVTKDGKMGLIDGSGKLVSELFGRRLSHSKEISP